MGQRVGEIGDDVGVLRAQPLGVGVAGETLIVAALVEIAQRQFVIATGIKRVKGQGGATAFGGGVEQGTVAASEQQPFALLGARQFR